MDEAELTKLKVNELKEKLKDAGLPTTGKKAELVARLLENQTSAGAADTPEADDAAAATTDGTDPTTTADEPAEVAAAAEEVTPDPTASDKRKRPAASPGATASPAAAAVDKKASRQERFGTGGESAKGGATKIAARAARFGLPLKGSKAAESMSATAKTGAGAGKNGGQKGKGLKMSPEELAKLKARAEKFGTADQISILAKEKKKEAERLAKEKLEKRKAKFGLDEPNAANGNKKARKDKGSKGKIAPVVALTPEQQAKVEARKKRFTT